MSAGVLSTVETAIPPGSGALPLKPRHSTAPATSTRPAQHNTILTLLLSSKNAAALSIVPFDTKCARPATSMPLSPHPYRSHTIYLPAHLLAPSGSAQEPERTTKFRLVPPNRPWYLGSSSATSGMRFRAQTQTQVRART
jgi:hypothetical protein